MSTGLPATPTAVPDVRQLEQQEFFRRTLARRNLYLTLAMLLHLLVLAFIMALHVDITPVPGAIFVLGYYISLAFDSGQTYFWLLIFVLVEIGLAYRGLYSSLDGKSMTQLYPADKSGERKFGGLTGQQLADMVHELAREMKAGQVRKIVVNDRPDPNAYTAHILGFGNIVVLHSNLLEIVPAEGVRAIVAHEVGHIRRKDSLMLLLSNIPRAYMGLVAGLILWKIGVGIFWFDEPELLFQRVLFVALVLAVALFLLKQLTRVANLAAQQSEHLADAYAAHMCGWGPTLNAFLLLGERAEAVHAVIKTLQKQPHLKGVAFTEEQAMRILHRLPPREIDDEIASKLAPRLYIEERLADLRDNLCVPLSDEDIVRLATQADHDLRLKQTAAETPAQIAERQRTEQQQAAELEKLLIDWRKFDLDRSGHLDSRETATLVAELRTNAHKMIFRQFLEPEAEWASHPTMRNRLLYLYDAFEKVM